MTKISLANPYNYITVTGGINIPIRFTFWVLVEYSECIPSFVMPLLLHYPQDSEGVLLLLLFFHLHLDLCSFHR